MALRFRKLILEAGCIFSVFFGENEFGAMSGSPVQRCKHYVGLFAGYVHAAALYSSFIG